MIELLPTWINSVFVLTLLGTLVLFHYANGKPKVLTSIIVAWSVFQAVLAYTGFYQVTDTMPPRFILVLLPVTVFIIYGLFPKQRRRIIARRNTRLSTFLHTIRIPVEIVLLYLYLHHAIPELMTFEGRNFDILAGLTAPIVGFLYWKGWLAKTVLLGWNVMGVLLVSFILFNGILSAELPFQQFAFDQPNKGITYFPFVLLPATIVPIVMYTHITDILKLRQEIAGSKKNPGTSSN